MSRDDRGFWIFDLPPLDRQAMDEFDTLPLDAYTPGGHRFRRFSTFRMHAAGRAWRVEQQPQRPFLQPRNYNALVGGVPRHFEPIRFDPTAQITVVGHEIGLDPSCDYALNLHQIRVVTDPATPGILVPEGPHRDGHELVLTAVFRRHNIEGGVSKLVPLGGGAHFFSVLLEPGQGLVVEDGRMWHDASPIAAIDGSRGYRDIWIVSINRWENRRYGEEFERRAQGLAEPVAGPDDRGDALL